ncbi:hypothetical protein B0T16DRAFT_418905 [Cercophora newfieldiana]|uniref:Uncharacterized protein n=1 Tax=Cercophora newfieldiana TaxID=92897 RepID=A0AA40CL31_9PEZI|nr:hypothetical protein B0T16DRAFT_418905 [Cercophora newfieldiana]
MEDAEAEPKRRKVFQFKSQTPVTLQFGAPAWADTFQCEDGLDEVQENPPPTPAASPDRSFLDPPLGQDPSAFESQTAIRTDGANFLELFESVLNFLDRLCENSVNLFELDDAADRTEWEGVMTRLSRNRVLLGEVSGGLEYEEWVDLLNDKYADRGIDSQLVRVTLGSIAGRLVCCEYQYCFVLHDEGIQCYFCGTVQKARMLKERMSPLLASTMEKLEAQFEMVETRVDREFSERLDAMPEDSETNSEPEAELEAELTGAVVIDEVLSDLRKDVYVLMNLNLSRLCKGLKSSGGTGKPYSTACTRYGSGEGRGRRRKTREIFTAMLQDRSRYWV